MKYTPLDIETTGLSFSKDRILGTGVGTHFYPHGSGFTIPERCTLQNGHFDIKFLTQRLPDGQRDDRWIKAYAFDTMLAASILIDRPESLSLDSLAAHYLNMPSWKDSTNKMFEEKNWVQKLEADPLRFHALMTRNLADLKATGLLTTVLEQRLKDEGMHEFFFEKLMPAARMLTEVEYRGMRIDVPATRQKLTDINQQLVELESQLNKVASELPPIKVRTLQTFELDDGFYSKQDILEMQKYLKAEGLVGVSTPNVGDWKTKTVTKEVITEQKISLPINWRSPKQVINILKAAGLDPRWYDFKKKAVVESSCNDCLTLLLPNSFIELILHHRQTTKLAGYLEGWLEAQHEGRIHPSYNMASTRTGRLSCSDPNLQQVPRDKSIRSLFIPSEGRRFIIADYAQIEPRVAAHYTQDVALLEVFEKGLDFYGSIANKVLGIDCHPNEVKSRFPNERKVSKEIGLSILYGIGSKKLSALIQKKAGIYISPEDCKQVINDYFIAYPELLAFRKYVEKKVYRGEILRTHYGRQFKIDPDKVFSTGVNTVVQSTASDACLFSQLEINRRLKAAGLDAPLVAIVHDEVIREVWPQDAEAVGKIMEEVMCNQGITCPLKLDWATGDNWGDKT